MELKKKKEFDYKQHEKGVLLASATLMIPGDEPFVIFACNDLVQLDEMFSFSSKRRHLFLTSVGAILKDVSVAKKIV